MSSTGQKIRQWYIVRCNRCGHAWDEEDPESEVCACIDTHGSRVVTVLDAGASNVMRDIYIRLDERLPR